MSPLWCLAADAGPAPNADNIYHQNQDISGARGPKQSRSAAHLKSTTLVLLQKKHTTLIHLKSYRIY